MVWGYEMERGGGGGSGGSGGSGDLITQKKLELQNLKKEMMRLEQEVTSLEMNSAQTEEVEVMKFDAEVEKMFKKRREMILKNLEKKDKKKDHHQRQETNQANEVPLTTSTPSLPVSRVQSEKARTRLAESLGGQQVPHVHILNETRPPEKKKRQKKEIPSQDPTDLSLSNTPSGLSSI